MYRITDQGYTDDVIAAVARGVQVRLITEPKRYRYVSRIWHSWNVDRMYMAGVEIKHRAHAGLNHQKSVILYDQDGNTPDDQTMVIFGSSNWTSASASGQVEHNIFTTKPDVARWLIDQFERKWNNTAGIVENTPFVPLPPDAPSKPLPAAGATGVASSNLKLTWFGGPWAHLTYYLDTNSNPSTRVATNLTELPSKNASSTFSYTLPVALNRGRRKTTGRLSENHGASNAVERGVELHDSRSRDAAAASARRGALRVGSAIASGRGSWRATPLPPAAPESAIPMRGRQRSPPHQPYPANYFEVTFTAEAGRPYRLWIRGKADSNSWSNDSVFVQFSSSVAAGLDLPDRDHVGD